MDKKSKKEKKDMKDKKENNMRQWESLLKNATYRGNECEWTKEDIIKVVHSKDNRYMTDIAIGLASVEGDLKDVKDKLFTKNDIIKVVHSSDNRYMTDMAIGLASVEGDIKDVKDRLWKLEKSIALLSKLERKVERMDIKLDKVDIKLDKLDELELELIHKGVVSVKQKQKLWKP